MAHKVILPKLGTNIDKAIILGWLKKEGERLTKGEVVVEVETSKSVFEVEAEHEGVLRKILYFEGSEIPITKTIAILAEPDEDISALEKQIKKEESIKVEKSYADQTWKDWFKGDAQLDKKALKGQMRMSPAARRIAQESNLNSEDLLKHFKGEKEVIEAKDVEDYINCEKLVIYGAGLGAKQALEIISKLSGIKIVGFIDDNPELKGRVIHSYKVLGGFGELSSAFKRSEFSGVVLSFHSEVRKKVFLRIKDKIPQIKIKTLIDSRAIVSDDVEIGEGTFIEAGAVIGPGVKIGDAVIVDLGVVICHDCQIGSYSHLSPGCTLSGIVCLKNNVLVGVGSSINSTVVIGENVIITPGSAVMNNIESDVLVSGIPAVVIGESRRGR